MAIGPNDAGVAGDVQAAINAGAAMADPRTPGLDPGTGTYTVVPKGYEIVSLDEYMVRPRRIAQDVRLQDTESFVEYVKHFKTRASRVFFNATDEEFHAVIDYHEAETPAWCDHVARYQPQRSVEFATWLSANRRQMTQVDFARFVEENLPDIVEPNSADLLNVALTFEAKKSVEFSSGVRLQNGQIQFQYDEVVRGTAQKGTIEIPEKFVLGIPIHLNGPAYRIDARFRWRLQEGKVTFWYEMVRPQKYIEHALKEIRSAVAEGTGVPVLSGLLGA